MQAVPGTRMVKRDDFAWLSVVYTPRSQKQESLRSPLFYEGLNHYLCYFGGSLLEL